MTTTQDDVTGQTLVTTTQYDALERVQAVADGAGNQVQKAFRYGTSGVSYELASNSYKSTPDSTMGWTMTTRDANYDTISVTSYSGNILPAPFAVGTSQLRPEPLPLWATCPALQVVAGRRLMEPDGAITNYSYNVLNNLPGVP